MDPLKQVQRLLAEHGFRLVREANHRVYRNPEGKVFVCAKTPSDWRAEQNSLANLQRAIANPPMPEVIAIKDFEREQAALLIQGQPRGQHPGKGKQKRSNGTGIFWEERTEKPTVEEEQARAEQAEKARKHAEERRERKLARKAEREQREKDKELASSMFVGIPDSVFDEWLDQYAGNAVRAELLFVAFPEQLKRAHMFGMSFWEGFRASLAFKEATKRFPNERVLILGACRAVHAEGDRLFTEATLSPLFRKGIEEGRLNPGNVEFLMAQVKHYLEECFPESAGLRKLPDTAAA